MKYRVSVAMATYNGERYIEKQLESIRTQSIGADEVIICDDKSTDKTVQIIEAFISRNGLENKWTLCINDVQKGYIKNFLSALKKTTGDYVFLADQDDIFYQNKFEKMLELMNKYEDALLVNADFELIDGNDQKITGKRQLQRARRRGTNKLNFKSWLKESSFPGFSMCLKRKLVDAVLEADINHCYGHDQLIGLIAISLDGNYETSTVLSGYRMHHSNVSGGLRIVDNYSLASRIAQKEKELHEYDQLIEMINNNHIKNIDYVFLDKRKKDLTMRIRCMKAHNIIGVIKLLVFCKTYPYGTILGDLLYLIKDKNL